MPYTWSWERANSRHSWRTWHAPQIAFACAICRIAGPVVEMGKKRSGSADRQAPPDRQLLTVIVAVIAGPHEVGR
jgi:hypothetical protein